MGSEPNVRWTQCYNPMLEPNVRTQWPLTWYPDLPKVIRGYWPWLAPHLSTVTKLRFWRFPVRSWDRICDSFYFTQVDSFIGSSWPFSASIRAIDPVCPQSFSDEGDVAPFRSAVCHKYSIKITKQHAILYGIEREKRLFKFHFAAAKSFPDMDLKS